MNDDNVIKKSSLWSLLFCGFTLILSFTFINIGQGLLSFQNHLGNSGLKKGSHVGFIETADIVTGLLFLPFWGALSYKFGRQNILLCGYMIMGIALIAYPSSTSTIPANFNELFNSFVFKRCIFSVGGSACSCMLSAIVGDVSQKKKIAKVTTLFSLFSGVGGFFGAVVIGNLNVLFEKIGIVSDKAIFLAFVINVVFVVLAAILGAIFLPYTVQKSHYTLLTDLQEVMLPKNVPCYLSSFTARMNTVLMPMFLSLMIKNEELSMKQSSYRMTSTIHHLMYLMTAPFWGMFIKKSKSFKAALLATLIASIGYILLYVVFDKWKWLYRCLVAFSAIGGMGVVITSSSVLSEISEEHNRSAFATVFSVSGALGILFLSQSGGFAIDKINPQFPLLITGFANLASFMVFLFSKSSYLSQ